MRPSPEEADEIETLVMCPVCSVGLVSPALAVRCRELGVHMSETLRTTVRTTPSRNDFVRAMLIVWPEATKEGCAILWAHFAGETTDGHHCWNHNLGNVKHVKGDGYDFVSLRGVWEGFTIKDEDGDGDIDADDRVLLVERLLRSGMWQLDPSVDHAKAVGPKKVSMIASPDNAATHFRAYPSLAIGMEKFVAMKRNPGGRYAGAWKFVEAGDPEGYARELGAKGYYTASPDAYAAAMRRKFDAFMLTTAFEDAAPLEVHDTPVTQLAVVASPDLLPTHANGSSHLVSVMLDGVEWLVAPVYIAPVGLGEARNLAKVLGFELPTPALVDAIWRAADLRVPPHLMVRRHDGIHMDTEELHTEQRRALEAFIGDRSLGRDFTLLAGAFKDIVQGPAGVVGIYGWHADHEAQATLTELKIPTYGSATPGEGRVIQGANFTAHSLVYRDFSQGLRLVRRA